MSGEATGEPADTGAARAAADVGSARTAADVGAPRAAADVGSARTAADVGAPRAAVDVGSNSIRVLVVDGAGQRITRELAITRLGLGVDRTGRLDDDALERSLDVIGRYRAIWEQHGVAPDRVRIAATSAVRDASDRDRFFDGVRRIAGVDAEVLSGDDEAALAFLGAAGAVEVARPTAVVDIGGGSTELIVGDRDGEVAGSVSLQLGCVRVTERHLADDPPSPSQVAGARAMAAEQLEVADTALGAAGLADVSSLVAVAGTATTLAALYLGLEVYAEDRIHGTRIPVEELRSLTDQLVGMSSAERAALGPMQPGREDVIHGGAIVLLSVLDRYGFDEVVVSEADNLDGSVASLR